MNITAAHCQSCGSTDYEDVGQPELEGYSGCCNERVIYPSPAGGGTDPLTGRPYRASTCDPRECHHLSR